MILELKNIFKSFSQGETKIDVLKNLNLNVQSNEKIAILGPSGSGKSTLLSLISGLDSPTQGDVLFAGQNLAKLSESELTQFRAKNIGIVFQQYHLLPYLTALENVSLPLDLKNQDGFLRATQLLDLVGLSHRKNHFPSQLSGGENQRVAIARALVTEPKLLIADEPSGSLDQVTGEKVMDCLFDVIQKTKSALILVTHNDQLAARCDRTIRLADGRAE